MQNQIHRASFWKRISAWLFDVILVAVIAVAVAFLVSTVVGYDTYSTAVDEAYQKYETEYGVEFDISADDYANLTDEERTVYDAAYKALVNDANAIHAYNMSVSLSIIITTAALLVVILLWEFAMPIIFGDGQTLGKKFFGICLTKSSGVKINNMQLLVRALLGKFTIEVMIPVYALLMLLWNSLNITVLIVVAIIAIVQLILFTANPNRPLIHDILAGTVVVDASTQRIFDSDDELLEYIKKQHADAVQNKPY